MRIKTTNSLILLIALPLLGGWYVANRAERQLLDTQTAAETALPAALLALDQLRQGSDRLTADVRAFASTGDVRWREDFETEVARDRNRTKAVEKLKALGITGDETRLLDNTLAKSTALIALEDQAFAAAGEKNFARAIALVYGDDYRTQKNAILEMVVLELARQAHIEPHRPFFNQCTALVVVDPFKHRLVQERPEVVLAEAHQRAFARHHDAGIALRV